MTSQAYMEKQVQNDSPEFAYHLLRGAVERFSKGLPELDEKQYAEARAQARKTYAMESLVLSTPEARDIVVAESKTEQALAEIAARYASHEDFLQDMAANGLTEGSLKRALQRELMFNAVMERVTAHSPAVSDLDVRLFYEFHKDRFTIPEKRKVRHVLITINEDYAENTRETAYQRARRIADKARAKPRRFHALARENSECPTAMQDGQLGEVKRGTLYPQLDAALFAMQEGEVSDVIETEVGFHVLYCEKIIPGKLIPRVKAEAKIRRLLEERQRRACQKAWLEPLKGRIDD